MSREESLDVRTAIVKVKSKVACAFYFIYKPGAWEREGKDSPQGLHATLRFDGSQSHHAHPYLGVNPIL